MNNSTPGDTLHCIDIADKWFDLQGCIDKDEFVGTFRNRESLLIAISNEHKRFWGFLWKTKKIINQDVDAVSRNPNTTIVEVEVVEARR